MSDDTTTLKPAGPTLSLLEGSPMSLVGPTGRPDSPGQGLSAPTGATGTVTAPGPELVNVTIDGRPLQFPKGTNLLEACNEAGANVPFFCYHPGLSAPAVCRQCLVDVKGQPKPVPSCYTPVADKMEVTTASPRVLDIRRQMLEFTLLNHPIDCPICDKAGECTLQKHYFDWDAKFARNDGVKVEKAKAVDLGKHIVLDQERCILCSRCIRVCSEVAKQPELTMAMRGDHEVLTTAPGRRLDNPYSLNTVDVCPVGALTSKDFRFASRAWELSSTPSVCPGCSTGCNIEVHAAHEVVKRLVPRPNEKVNKYWMCDEGRFTYKRALTGRLGVPSVGGVPTEWDAALDAAAAKLRAVLDVNPASVGVVFSAQSTNEDLYVASALAFDHLGLKRAYLAGRDQGWHDDILVSADRNPNTAGAIAVGAGRLRSLLDLSQDLKKGELKALLVIGEDGVLAGDNATAVLPLGGLETLVVLAWNRDALVDQATVALPLAAWTEVDGTFTNKQGFVQRIRPATPAVGDSLPTWEVLGHLGRRLGLSKDYSSARAVFLEAKQTLPFMKEADWGKTSLPVHLRFANSRG